MIPGREFREFRTCNARSTCVHTTWLNTARSRNAVHRQRRPPCATSPPGPPGDPPHLHRTEDSPDDDRSMSLLSAALPGLTISIAPQTWEGAVKLALAIAGLLLAGGAAYTWLLIDRLVQQMQRLERELTHMHSTVRLMGDTVDSRVQSLHVDLTRELGSMRSIQNEMQVLSHSVDTYVGSDIPRMVQRIHGEARVLAAGGVLLAVYAVHKLRRLGRR